MLNKWMGVFSVTLLMTVAGCASNEYASNQPKQYLKSKNGPDLIVPGHLTAYNLSDFYHLPNQPAHAQLKVRITPPKISDRH